MIKLKVKDFGEIEIELDFENAPNTAANFLELARNGFYDGLTFHRVIKGFMIQGGDPLGNGTGGPDYHIEGEFRSNGFDNKLHHTRGVISMARSFMPDSAGSQFFIMHKDAPHLDGEYAAFGKVTKGLEVIDAIAVVKTNMMDKPLQKVIIEKVEVVNEVIREVKKIMYR